MPDSKTKNKKPFLFKDSLDFKKYSQPITNYTKRKNDTLYVLRRKFKK